jgi:hypothetical protein
MAENVLHKLIWNGKYEEVEKLLKSPKGPELARQKDEKGDLPLHLVATIAPMYSSVDSLWSTTSQTQVTEMQQRLDNEKQQNQTRNTENATLQVFRV